jgi:FOG: Ankyrin repeat
MKRTLLERLDLLDKRVAYLESKKDLDDLKNYLGDDLFDRYMQIRDRIPKSMNLYKDFQSLKEMPVYDVEDFVSNFKSNAERRKTSKSGAKSIYEDDDWKVYKITTYDAAKYYGKGTRWCITGNYEGHEHLGEKYFNDYIKEKRLDGGYYFYINKNNPNLKFCILQNVGGKVLSIWDSEDSNLGSTLGDVKKFNLPKVPGINLSNYSIDALTRAMDDEDWDEVYDIIIHGDLNLNQWDRENRTALELASLLENEKAVHLLIQHGADPDVMSGNGFTPLLNAVIWENYKITELLLNAGADPDIPDGNRHKTPLFVAAQKGYIDIVKLLVDKFGADTSIKSNVGATPLDTAIANNKDGRNQEVIDYLMSVGAKMTVDPDDYK